MRVLRKEVGAVAVLIALDCEANGLHGKTFIVAAVAVAGDGNEAATFLGRCPVEDGPLDEWVAENVVPVCADIAQTHDSYAEMCAAYDSWYQERKSGAEVAAHIAWPVEARFLLAAHAVPFSGPYPLLDTACYLRAAGAPWDTEIGYAETNGIVLPAGRQHNPLFDARLTAAVYQHLTQRQMYRAG